MQSAICPSRLFIALLLLESAYISLDAAFRPLWVSYPQNKVSAGCQTDNEGSWSIGVFKGSSPFTLKPIELVEPRVDGARAWPVANPVLTCASVTDAPSNFVADPFIWAQGDKLYIFYETKNSVTLQGDIAVAQSVDGGATWTHLGVCLDEKFHLSYPFVFEYEGETYMMPEGSRAGDLRLYRAVNFPLKWELAEVIIRKPLVDASLVHYNDTWWLFASDPSRYRYIHNGELEVYYSSSPLGPWHQHSANPVVNGGKSSGARSAGRPLVYNGHLYRFGQDCGETYGKRVKAFRIEKLTTTEYKEVPTSLNLKPPTKGNRDWNGVRQHHFAALQLPSGEWIAAMDGDRVASGDHMAQTLRSCLLVLGFVVVNIIIWSLCRSVRLRALMKRMGATDKWGAVNGSSNGSWSPTKKSLLGLVRTASLGASVKTPRGQAPARSYVPLIIAAAGVLAMVVLAIFIGQTVHDSLSTGSAAQAIPIDGQYSKFTLVCMTYDARLWNLKMYVRHYSRCSSVGEIVVAWNKGPLPSLSEFDSAVPLRFRKQVVNSLNNRFEPDPLLHTKAVLELDDDILMTCGDLERGFAEWRQNPQSLVGYYPRLLEGTPLVYRNEKYAFGRGAYNVILTGASFLDSETYFEAYFSEGAAKARAVVDDLFNCEDIMMNFVVAAKLKGSQAVEYVRPAWRIDMSKFSAVGISKDQDTHLRKRNECLRRLVNIYGGNPLKKWDFQWDMEATPVLTEVAGLPPKMTRV